MEAAPLHRGELLKEQAIPNSPLGRGAASKAVGWFAKFCAILDGVERFDIKLSYTQQLFPILYKQEIAKGIFDFAVQVKDIAKDIKPGQFVHILPKGFTLRRPISICDVIAGREAMRLVFEVRGEGTKELSLLSKGDCFDMIAPLGNGFDIKDISKKAVFVGGGIGVPPLVMAAKGYGENATAILGFRNKDAVILADSFALNKNNVRVCTDDGSLGQKGFTTDLLCEHLKDNKPDVIYTCGPTPMIKRVAAIAMENDIPCQVSLEERMGCGVGACLVCACKIKAEQDKTVFAHVCKDGPVFDGRTVIFDD